MTHIKITDESKTIAASPAGAPDPDDATYWIPFVAHASETVVLEEVENMEERVYTASLQVKVSIGPAPTFYFKSFQFVSRKHFDVLRDNILGVQVVTSYISHWPENDLVLGFEKMFL